MWHILSFVICIHNWIKITGKKGIPIRSHDRIRAHSIRISSWYFHVITLWKFSIQFEFQLSICMNKINIIFRLHFSQIKCKSQSWNRTCYSKMRCFSVTQNVRRMNNANFMVKTHHWIHFRIEKEKKNRCLLLFHLDTFLTIQWNHKPGWATKFLPKIHFIIIMNCLTIHEWNVGRKCTIIMFEYI